MKFLNRQRGIPARLTSGLIYSLVLSFVLLSGMPVMAEEPLPENFTDIPLYPRSTVLTVTNSRDGEQVALHTMATVKDLVNYYSIQLDALDWEPVMDMIQEELAALTFAKGDVQLVVAVGAESGGLRVYTLTLSPR